MVTLKTKKITILELQRFLEITGFEQLEEEIKENIDKNVEKRILSLSALSDDIFKLSQNMENLYKESDLKSPAKIKKTIDKIEELKKEISFKKEVVKSIEREKSYYLENVGPLVVLYFLGLLLTKNYLPNCNKFIEIYYNCDFEFELYDTNLNLSELTEKILKKKYFRLIFPYFELPFLLSNPYYNKEVFSYLYSCNSNNYGDFFKKNIYSSEVLTSYIREQTFIYIY